MERSAIRGNLDVQVPDFAHRARIRATHWLHPGYKAVPD
jgi:hypothetical protein